MDFLAEVVSKTKLRIESLRKRLPLLRLPPLSKRSLYAVFQRDTEFKIIAEVKRSSPSAGIILQDYEPEKIAKEYEDLGFDIISCLTEPFFFGGDIKDLRKVKKSISLPVLRKDFILEEIQIEESKVFGADAILLIAKLLKKQRLKDLFREAKNQDIDILVEVFDREDLEEVLELEPPLIGINNRNLKGLDVDLRRTLGLLPFIPKDIMVISESGIRSIQDIEILREAGVRGFLIGESFLKDKDFRKEVKAYRERTSLK